MLVVLECTLSSNAIVCVQHCNIGKLFAESIDVYRIIHRSQKHATISYDNFKRRFVTWYLKGL